MLGDFEGQADLIITSPPYADARHKHYDSVHPDAFADWFLTFHEPFWNVLKPTGSLVLNIKDKVVDGVRHRFVWRTIEALAARGWFAIDDYMMITSGTRPTRCRVTGRRACVTAGNTATLIASYRRSCRTR